MKQCKNAKWIEVSPAKILASRSMATTPGAMLVHSTLGWHTPEKVNERYETLFGKKLIDSGEIPDLERLWILRHSVAHNAGYITSYDASRLNAVNLADTVANIDANFISETKDFLIPIGGRVAEEIGMALLSRWFSSVKGDGSDFTRDQVTYKRLKDLATMVHSRTREVPQPTEQDYLSDFPAN